MKTTFISFSLVVSLLIAFSAAAQQVSQETQDTLAEIPSGEEVLRLEDTIRGNREQPQVLTIVPWQLPIHQRIDENKEWQQQVTSLNSIERGAFLRNLALKQTLKERINSDSDEQVDTKQSKLP
jgi:hypothetical protein